MRTSTPRRLPAEWEAHVATIVAWPGRSSVWEEHLQRAQAETLALANEIAKDERVLLAVNPARYEELVAQANDLTAEVVPMPLDDCWARDISPFFVFVEGSNDLHAIDFAFNAWGEKFEPHDGDAAFGRAMSEHIGVDHELSDLVLEGGSITTDGAGTAIVVETSVLNQNRNPGRTRDEVEETLGALLGIETVIWLPFGLLGDTDTDGHVDNVAVFCAPARVLVQVAPNASHADAERMSANRIILNRSRDARGRQLDLVEVPWLPVSSLDKSRPCSYVNAYPTNRRILVPAVGDDTDDKAAELLSEAFGWRPPVSIPSNALSYGGGGPHCMTMQIPAFANLEHEGEVNVY